ncbi:unnamed protein product [Calypogeia fissa]
MAVSDPIRQHSFLSRSVRRSLDVMGFSALLKVPTEVKLRRSNSSSGSSPPKAERRLPFENSNSSSERSSPKADDFDHPHSVGDNSEAATNGSARVKRDAPSWRRSIISLLRRSNTPLAKSGTGTQRPSSSDSEGVTFNSSKSFSATSSSDAADLEAYKDISEAINESSRIQRDAEGRRGSITSLSRRFSELFAKLPATDGGLESSPNAETITEERRRQECTSKLEEDSTHAHEGEAKRNIQTIDVQDEKIPTCASGQTLEGPEQLDEHRQGSTRAVKDYINIKKRVNQLRKNRSDREYRRKVVVNGVPIKDVDVKKAEELAGPIHPGSYWYDIQAGFWGLEPGPCLGMIPPCILQLNAPMSGACSGGSTGILVNGRELHQKDLERLSSRGLPTAPGMAYCISVDGRVMDESSRKYVTGLGLLAPSLGKNKRGSGIYMPAVY